MWVMPSSSARCAQLPRAADKVPYYAALKKFRDYLNGAITHLDESDIVFADAKLKKKDPDTLEGKKSSPADDLERENANHVLDGIKQEGDVLIPGKKKRGRPKKIKNPEDQPMPDVDKLDGNGEVVKKRRGRPKKIHQQQKLQEREAKEREQQQQQQQAMSHHHMGVGDAYGCFSPSMMSPPKPFPHMAPYPSMNDGYFSQGMGDGGYGMNKQSPVHLHPYQSSPKPMSLGFGHSDLSSEINTAMSSENNLEPSPLTSPSVEQPDFEPPSGINQQDPHGSYNPDVPGVVHGSPSTTSHSSYASYMGYPSEQDAHQQPTPMSQDEHSHHSHPTPHASPHPHEYKRAQDVASKSLSGLENLVDQIPSIADAAQQRLQHDDGMDKMDPHHQHQVRCYLQVLGQHFSN